MRSKLLHQKKAVYINRRRRICFEFPRAHKFVQKFRCFFGYFFGNYKAYHSDGPSDIHLKRHRIYAYSFSYLTFCLFWQIHSCFIFPTRALSLIRFLRLLCLIRILLFWTRKNSFTCQRFSNRIFERNSQRLIPSTAQLKFSKQSSFNLICSWMQLCHLLDRFLHKKVQVCSIKPES